MLILYEYPNGAKHIAQAPPDASSPIALTSLGTLCAAPVVVNPTIIRVDGRFNGICEACWRAMLDRSAEEEWRRLNEPFTFASCVLVSGAVPTTRDSAGDQPAEAGRSITALRAQGPVRRD